MSIRNKATNYDRDEMLERVILDDQLDVFKDEINRKLVQFRTYKAPLLCSLFKNCNCAQPSDGQETAWLQIEAIAHQCIAREILKHTVNSNADQVARYRAIADAARDATGRIQQLRHADLGTPILKAWLDGTMGLLDATEEYTNQLYKAVGLDGKITRALDVLIELETAANRVANEAHKGRGRPDGSSILPGNYIPALKRIYREASGKKKGASNFVQKFFVAIGKKDETKNDYAVEAPKYQRWKARKRKEIAAVPRN